VRKMNQRAMNGFCIREWLALIGAAAFAVLLLAGCSKKEGTDQEVSKGEGAGSQILARVGGTSITVSDFKNSLAAGPGSFSYRVTSEAVTKRLDEMILEEVLYKEALRLKLDEDPEMRERIRRMLTQRLLDEQMKREVWDKEVEEKDLEEYYKQRWDLFNRPEQVRVADIYISVPRGATETERADLREKAEGVLAETLAAREERTGFGKLIEKYSDSPEKYRKGDTGFMDIDGEPVGVDKAVAEAAFRLDGVGSVSESLIETADGYHVIMLTGKRSAVQRPLESVKGELKRMIQRDAAARVRQAYLEELKRRAKIEIQKEQVAALVEELKSEAKEAVSTKSRIPFPPGTGDPPPPLRGRKD
jgi:parvulin-like peptidyl-prolyl isomerase